MGKKVGLTIFYDGFCPLCVAEMQQLQAFDRQNRLQMEDVQALDFAKRYPQFDRELLNKKIHALTASGEVLTGLDVTCLSWRLVGKKRWLSILRWPVIRYGADFAYWLFARYRYQISYLITGKKPCQVCEYNDKK